MTWLSGIWGTIKTTWKSIIEWEGWTKIGEFLTNTWNWIVNLLSGNSAGESGGST